MKKPAAAATVAMIVLTVSLLAQVGWAHKVNLFGYAEGGFVHVEGYFTDGAPSVDSEVEVFGPKGELVAQGSTDGDGRFFFPAEEAGRYRIAMNASLGHVSEIDVEVGDSAAVKGASAATGGDGALSASPIDGAELSALKEKVENLTEEVRALRKRVEKPGFSQIVGGLGFIAGIAGAYLWGASRKKG